MLNETIVEGIVTSKIWQYAGDKFFRLAVYRDPARPGKPVDPGRETGHTDEPDYITVRVTNGLISGVPLAIERNQKVRIHGYLVSRDDRLTLRDFLKQAGNGAEKIELPDEHLNLSIETYRVDMQPERIVCIE